jgi:DNA-binding ferritin-like protein
METLLMIKLLETRQDAEKLEAASPLEETLVDILDLSLQVEQVRWRLNGPGSSRIHRRLDDFRSQYRFWDQELSGRLESPSGERLATLAAATPLELPRAGQLRDKDVIVFFDGRFTKVADRVRSRRALIGAEDGVAGDLLDLIAAGLERQGWMLRADIENRNRSSAPGSESAARRDPSAA